MAQGVVARMKVRRQPSRRSVRYVAALAACLVVAAGCKGPWGWGQNNFGQVGDGTTTTRTAPVELDPGYTVVAAGDKHTVAVRTNGTLWAWGVNGSGRLGDGTTTDRLVPTQVGTATTWKTVSAGAAHTVALRTDGSLWAWGSNASGQLGDGTTTTRTAPVHIGTDTWASISAGADHTVGIRTDGTLWAWGLNSDRPGREQHDDQPTGTGPDRYRDELELHRGRRGPHDRRLPPTERCGHGVATSRASSATAPRRTS